jgi:hypothetical protein
MIPVNSSSRIIHLRRGKLPQLFFKNEELNRRVDELETLLFEAESNINLLKSEMNKSLLSSLSEEESDQFNAFLALHREHWLAGKKQGGKRVRELNIQLVQSRFDLEKSLGVKFTEISENLLFKMQTLYQLEWQRERYSTERDKLNNFKRDLLKAIDDLQDKAISQERIIEIHNSVFNNSIAGGDLSIGGNFSPNMITHSQEEEISEFISNLNIGNE